MTLPKALTWTELRKRWHVGCHYDSDYGFSWRIEDRETNQTSHYCDDEEKLQRIVDRANRRWSAS